MGFFTQTRCDRYFFSGTTHCGKAFTPSAKRERLKKKNQNPLKISTIARKSRWGMMHSCRIIVKHGERTTALPQRLLQNRTSLLFDIKLCIDTQVEVINIQTYSRYQERSKRQPRAFFTARALFLIVLSAIKLSAILLKHQI